jgi:PKHD-type hydroxylase
MYKFQQAMSSDPLEWYWFKNGFTNEEVDQIVAESKNWDLQTAGVTDAGVINDEMRKSAIAWVPQLDHYRWIYGKLGGMIEEANNALWKFNLYSMDEQIQYTEYYQNGGHYDYHLDIGGGFPLNQRKISITVQLSGPDEYQGGDFEILRGKNPESLPKQRGCVLVFPSYLLHRVTPVTQGTRRSLVLWIGGDSYK